MNILHIAILSLILLPVPALAEDDHDHSPHDPATETEHGHQGEEHGHEEGEEGHEEGVIRLSPEQRAAEGIETARVTRKALSGMITAPGEVVVDAYRAARVTPRIPGQVIARHAKLGDAVKPGQRLVTLSSVEMARAQGDLLVADREWQRVRRLGKKVVSERRYVEAQVARQLALARVRAYGMGEAQIEALLKRGDVSRATGEFDLTAPIAGTVIEDNFILGELIEPGRVMFDLADESTLWVEARLNPDDAARVVIGAPARIAVHRGEWLPGQVIQIHHRLEEATRTQSVRIRVDNRRDRLHPGQFVQAVIETEAGEAVLAVPEEAVTLMQGAQVVFRVEGDEIHPQPVETGLTRAGWTEIRAGLEAGDEIVVRGVFFLKSLLLKSQMGEGHAH